MVKFKMLSGLVVALVSVNVGQSYAQKPPLELIGGLTTNLLISTNLSIGLADELQHADASKRGVTAKVAEHTEKTIKKNLGQLDRWQKSAKLSAADADYLKTLVKGLEGVAAQAAALKTAMTANNNPQYDEYLKKRKETFEIIKKVTE